ncbi:MAG: metabolite traffic protein EboE [Rubripirellula sp.]
MTNLTPKETIIGYCTNVHAGVDLESIRQNLLQFAVPARRELGRDELGVGLWLPAQAARQLAAGEAAAFGEFLSENQLRAYTINGFPYDNFHQPIVKRRVYEPTWWQDERLQYTKQLADVLTVLLPASDTIGSISTLPIGWPSDSGSDAEREHQLDQAGANFRELAAHLRQLESDSGKRIVVAIEPEPGCILDTTDDMIDWFDKHLPDEAHRRFITVCHDVCHSAVMMEPQSEVVGRLAAAGIAIGKVQVSSAISVDWEAMAVGRRREAIDQLSQFAEDRYLHQTGRRTENDQFELAEDLPGLLALVAEQSDPVWGDKKWVVHFHVPIFLERFGHLGTSQSDVVDLLSALRSSPVEFSGHLEVETYAWTVLPPAMRKRGLSEDIASEIKWLKNALLS